MYERFGVPTANSGSFPQVSLCICPAVQRACGDFGCMLLSQHATKIRHCCVSLCCVCCHMLHGWWRSFMSALVCPLPTVDHCLRRATLYAQGLKMCIMVYDCIEWWRNFMSALVYPLPTTADDSHRCAFTSARGCYCFC